MAELWFYHLERTELERALPPLLEKCLERGWRALIRGGSPERLDALDATLWTYRDESFRACLLFDGRDEHALNSARSRWKEAKAAGVTASYWKESAAGKWEKQS
jgi:DNA polymerase III subunit chi